MKKLITLIAVTATLTACGSIDRQITSDQSIQEKTGFALGISPDKITITNRSSDLESVHFNASANGKIYQCYYTTVLAVQSDVLCHQTDGGKPLSKPESSSTTSSKSCNALLKAAGKC